MTSLGAPQIQRLQSEGANTSGRNATTFLVCVVLSLMISNLVIVARIRRDPDLHKFFSEEHALAEDNVGESSSTHVQRKLLSVTLTTGGITTTTPSNKPKTTSTKATTTSTPAPTSTHEDSMKNCTGCTMCKCQPGDSVQSGGKNNPYFSNHMYLKNVNVLGFVRKCSDKCDPGDEHKEDRHTRCDVTWDNGLEYWYDTREICTTTNTADSHYWIGGFRATWEEIVWVSVGFVCELINMFLMVRWAWNTTFKRNTGCLNTFCAFFGYVFCCLWFPGMYIACGLGKLLPPADDSVGNLYKYFHWCHRETFIPNNVGTDNDTGAFKCMRVSSNAVLTMMTFPFDMFWTYMVLLKAIQDPVPTRLNMSIKIIQVIVSLGYLIYQTVKQNAPGPGSMTLVVLACLSEVVVICYESYALCMTCRSEVEKEEEEEEERV